MLIDLKQIFDIVGEVKDINCEIDLSEQEFNGYFPFKTPVSISGKFCNRAGIVTLTYTADFSMELICDRCLSNFSKHFSLSNEHTLIQKLNTDSDDFIVAQDSKLDLTNLIRTDILLDLPSKTLCRQDCKGLCQVCGKNLNTGSCNCESKTVDPRLEILSSLLT